MLYEKVKALAPTSAVVDRLAAVLESPPTVESSATPPAVAAATVELSNEVPDTVSIAEADGEAHYSLGVAYKNMGLYQEAIDEFQTSMDNAAYYLDSCLMTALCYKEGRQFANAICMLEPILFDPRCQSAKGQAIRYELGLLYEAESQWDDAAKTYQSIPSFHDVPQRLAALEGRSGMSGGEFRLAS